MVHELIGQHGLGPAYNLLATGREAPQDQEDPDEIAALNAQLTDLWAEHQARRAHDTDPPPPPSEDGNDRPLTRQQMRELERIAALQEARAAQLDPPPPRLHTWLTSGPPGEVADVATWAQMYDRRRHSSRSWPALAAALHPFAEACAESATIALGAHPNDTPQVRWYWPPEDRHELGMVRASDSSTVWLSAQLLMRRPIDVLSTTAHETYHSLTARAGLWRTDAASYDQEEIDAEAFAGQQVGRYLTC
jgi:hypothetical protein